MTRRGLGLIALVAGAAAALATTRVKPPRPTEGGPAGHPPAVLSAPGRIEGARSAVELMPAVDGTIAAVFVSEGDHVRTGQIVARLQCGDIEADARGAASQTAEARAALARLLRGGRDDARAEAMALSAAAEARANNAVLDLERATRLFEDDRIVPRTVVDQAERNARVAKADLEAARQHAAVVGAEPLDQDRAAAEAKVRSARWSERAAAERVAKCSVASPIDGVVLRRYLDPGERVVAWSPRPVVTVADISAYRVRIEVDERDIALVGVGQRAEITADGFGGATLHGVVSEIGSEMGRKHVRSGDPAEKADRDVLEAIVTLPSPDVRLVVGLRVTAVLRGETPSTRAGRSPVQP
jgi:multidrug resistance efflux pump